DWPPRPATTSLAAAADGSVMPVTNIKVASYFGFQPGEQFKVDANTPSEETETVTKVGSASAQSTLAAPVHAGDTEICLASATNFKNGDPLTLDTGAGQESSLKIAQVGINAGTTATTLASAVP